MTTGVDLAAVRRATEAGITLDGVADICGVTREVVDEWVAEDPDFANAVNPKKSSRAHKFTPKTLTAIRRACEAGLTNQEVADLLGVAYSTFSYWLATNPLLVKAMTVGKEVADNRVEMSLYQRAIGYQQPAVKIFMPTGAVAPVYARYVEQVAPDVTACYHWLKNRRPNEWRDRREVSVTGPNGGPLKIDEQVVDAETAMRVYRQMVEDAT